MIGIALRERLTGAMVLRGETHEEPIALDLAHSICPFERPLHALEGTLDALPFALGARARGQGKLDEKRGTLSYDLALLSDSRGKPRDVASDEARRIVLERDLDRANLYTSITVLTGRILDDQGETLARCLLRFDVRSEAGAFVRSIRMLTARTARRTFDGGGAAW